MNSALEQYVNVPGTQLWFKDVGQGVPLLLVHGFPLDHTMWSAQIDALPSRCRLIAPDLRGFGRSPLGADDDVLTMERLADDLAMLLDALEIGGPVVLCGLSMGGYVALQFVRQYASRLRGLILCDTRAAADSPEAAAARLAMADRVLREGNGPLVEAMLPRILSGSTARNHPRVLEALRRVMMGTSPRTVAAAQRGMARRPDMTAALARISCSTLVLVGAEDASSPPAEMRAMADAIAGARYVEIPEAGHLAPLENPAAVNAAILGCLDGIASRSKTTQPREE